MSNLTLLPILTLGLMTAATAQTRSSARSIPLRAIVPATIKISPGSPALSEGNATAIAQSTAENRIRITVIMRGQTHSPRVRVPVRVTTNARTYVFRVASLKGADSGTIRVAPSASVNSREQSLNVNRVFALASNRAGTTAEQHFIEVNLTSIPHDEVHEVQIEVEAVPL